MPPARRAIRVSFHKRDDRRGHSCCANYRRASQSASRIACVLLAGRYTFQIPFWRIKIKTAIIILGYKNSPEGVLDPVSITRGEEALRQLKALSNVDAGIIPTGGFGAHFNTSPSAHSKHVSDYLIRQNLDPNKVWGLVESVSTIEDAVNLRPLVKELAITNLRVITSNFHLVRAKYIFETVFPNLTIDFVAISASRELCAFHEHHETKRLMEIKRDGIVGL